MVQYIPATGDGSPEVVPAPTSLTATGNAGFVSLRWAVGPEWQAVEIFASASNDRAYAEEVGEVSADHFNHSLPDGGTRYYWVRGIAGAGPDRRVSDWYPSGATAGVSGSASPSGLAWNVSASNGRAWVGDASTSPVGWEPTGTTTDITADMLRFGALLDREIVRVTLNTSTGALTWVSITDDSDIATTATATPANTITFTFTHTPSGLVTTETVVAVTSGAPGGPGAPGVPAYRILSVRANRSDMTATVVNGSMYVHGFDSLGNPAAVPGNISFNGDGVSVPNGAITTSQDVSEGWLLLETDTGSTPFSGARIGATRKSRSGWVYDNGTAWTSFTATATMVAFGTYGRASGAIGTAVIIGNGMALSAVPYEYAHQVQPGDLQSGAISDLDAFASTLRPISVVSSLPTLPAAAYPNGALVYLTSDKKIYRADYAVSPDAWIKTVDGGDITAGSITAAALAADIVLATLFRTNSTGTRVELEGNGHDFPFWIGSGTKGSASGSPGSGAKVYYDAVADEFVVTGTLRTAEVEADGELALSVRTSSGYLASIGLMNSKSQDLSGIDAADGEVVLGNATQLYHPSSSAGIPSRRLQAADQAIVIDLLTFCESETPGTSVAIGSGKIQYRYDSGSWQDLPTGSGYGGLSWNTSRSCISRSTFAVIPKSTGWTSILELRVVGTATNTAPTYARLISCFALYVMNLGNQSLTAITMS
jgi:hypothetical protein